MRISSRLKVKLEEKKRVREKRKKEAKYFESKVRQQLNFIFQVKARVKLRKIRR